MRGTAKSAPPLPLVDMTEAQLMDELMANFPLRWPIEKCRAALERMVRRIGEAELSPASIELAYLEDWRRIVDGWPDAVRWRRLTEAQRAALRRAAPEWAAEMDAAAERIGYDR